MTFAEKLKNIRKQAGISKEQLAEKLGVSRQAVTKWETDAGIPDMENIMAVSALFDISIDELFPNERGMRKPAERFDMSDTDNIIELNGIKSELVNLLYSVLLHFGFNILYVFLDAGILFFVILTVLHLIVTPIAVLLRNKCTCNRQIGIDGGLQ